MVELHNAVHVTLHDRTLGNELNDSAPVPDLIYRNTTEEQALLFAISAWQEYSDTNRYYFTASTYETQTPETHPIYLWDDEKEEYR
jgi:hypothetical protein